LVSNVGFGTKGIVGTFGTVGGLDGNGSPLGGLGNGGGNGGATGGATGGIVGSTPPVSGSLIVSATQFEAAVDASLNEVNIHEGFHA